MSAIMFVNAFIAKRKSVVFFLAEANVMLRKNKKAIFNPN